MLEIVRAAPGKTLAEIPKLVMPRLHDVRARGSSALPRFHGMMRLTTKPGHARELLPVAGQAWMSPARLRNVHDH